MAGWVGGGGVACDGEGLTTASAEVDLTPVAGPAGLVHPGKTAKRLKDGTMAPDFTKVALANIIEDKAGQGLRRVTGQDAPRGCNDDN
jgi:hypothetical protein